MNSKVVKPKPFLRWAGGKSWLTNQIENFLPTSFNNYHEPFIGGASIFIFLKSKGYIKGDTYLSDSNIELINTYQIVKNQLDHLISELRTYQNDSSFYYQMRSSRPQTELLKAARFLYLNRTSYNGIYRENSKGEYNVPYGRRCLSEPFDFHAMKEFSREIENTVFQSFDFEQTLINIKEGDLVFLDPPYTVAHENNGFIEYNKKIFSWEDQRRLKDFILEIIKRNAYYILTNAAHYSLDNLYAGIGKKEVLSRYSTIGGKGAKRETYNEYIFFNTK